MFYSLTRPFFDQIRKIRRRVEKKFRKLNENIEKSSDFDRKTRLFYFNCEVNKRIKNFHNI